GPAANIVWEDNNTGNVAYWTANSNGSHNLGSLGSVGAGSPWQITGVADVTGGLASDIQWRNTTTGETGVWKVENAVGGGDVGIYHHTGSVTGPWAIV